MKLTYKNYVIETALYGGYDLYQNIVSTNKETGEKYDNTQVIGYNMGLDSAVLKLVELEIRDKNETYELKEGLKEILKVYNEIKNEVKL